MDRFDKLGEVSAPSGRLLLLGEERLAGPDYAQQAIEVDSIPAAEPLAVRAERMVELEGPVAWRTVRIELQPGAQKAWSEKAGQLTVEQPWIMLADPATLGDWRHDSSLDGRSDLLIRGRDAEAVAATVGAEPLEDAWGWLDLESDECARKARLVERLEAINKRAIEVEIRAHSHHQQMLQQALQSPVGAAQIDLGGARLCAFHTSWDAGSFPVLREIDEAGRLVALQIELNTVPVDEAVRSTRVGLPDSCVQARERAERERVERERQQQQKAERDLAKRARAEQRRAERERTKQERAEQRRAERERTKQERAEQRRAERERTKQERAERRRAERERRRQERLAAAEAARPEPIRSRQVPGGNLTLVTPSGYRIEGMTAGDVRQVLENLP